MSDNNQRRNRDYDRNNDYNNRNRNQNYDSDPYQDGEQYDDYQRQYEEQLRQYTQFDNADYDADNDLEFHEYNRQANRPNYDDYDRQNNYDNYNGQQGQNSQNGQNRQRQNPNRNNQRNSSQNGNNQNRNNQNRSNQGKSNNKNKTSKNNAQRSANNKNQQTRNNNSTRNAPNKTNNYNQNNKKAKNKKMRKQKRKKRSIFKTMLSILLIIFILLNILLLKYLGKVNYVENGTRQVTNASMKSSDVLNVLVIGSDTRSSEERGRTDSMILLSVNKKTKEFTMTSFMRDMYVEIPSYGWAKMNEAYVHGGAEMLMDTIELNFDIAVDKYVYVDFFAFVDIVDALGGIELDISDEEAEGMIPPMAEQNKYLGNKKGTDYLTSGGENMKANGNQALAYARLRYVGNSDFERTERQRTVITKILEKSTKIGPFKFNNFANACMSNLTTNMTKSELYLLTYRAPFILGYENQELRIPAEGAYTYGNHNSQSTLDVDFDKCKQDLNKTIYHK